MSKVFGILCLTAAFGTTSYVKKSVHPTLRGRAAEFVRTDCAQGWVLEVAHVVPVHSKRLCFWVSIPASRGLDRSVYWGGGEHIVHLPKEGLMDSKGGIPKAPGVA